MLRGNDLEIVRNGTIVIDQFGTIENISNKNDREVRHQKGRKNCQIEIIDAEGFIILPGFINSHTHIGDSIGKDISSNADLNTRVHPYYSIKKTILDKTPKDQLNQMINNTAISMINKGITTFADFREGGLQGINLLQNALNTSPINRIILGRIESNLKLPPKRFSKSATINSSSSKPKIARNKKSKTSIESLKPFPKMLKEISKEKKNKSVYIDTKTVQKRPYSNVEEISEEKNDQDKGGKEQLKSYFFESGENILKKSQGFGISGANENSDEMLSWYNQIASRQKDKKTKKTSNQDTNENSLALIAIHAAESKGAVEESMKKHGITEIQRTLKLLNPDIYVHVTNANYMELELLARNNKKIIVCPRANGILGVGLAPLKKMLELHFEPGIGTDNIMINSPDMFREMDFLLKSQRALQKDTYFLDAKDILKMATVNGGKIFGIRRGCIEQGYNADFVFIDRYDMDLYPVFDLYTSIVTRCSERQVKGVMINGELVLEKTVIR
jgi:cytosine/adenosine deaminase-related metal-dependent hydrolase